MFELIRTYQLDIMLMLCGGCFILIFLLMFTRFMSKSRKLVLIHMELTAFLLLWFDRLAYIYAGDPGRRAYIMVRVSNFVVFFLTSAVVFFFNLYIIDLLTQEGKIASPPKPLIVTGALTVVGMLLSVVSAFTGLYYYFDETNRYHRGQGFLIAYIIPVLCPLIQFFVIRKYKQCFSRLIYHSLLLYIFVPIACGILQIFTYGISIVNMAMVAVSVSLYIFMYLDLNNTVEHAHEIELNNMMSEKEKMEKLFGQTATAFVSAVEKKDDFAKGNAIRIADYAKKIALMAGKDEEESEKVYYAALLHDVGLIGIPDSVIKHDTDPDKRDYEETFFRDLVEANKEVVISSPRLNRYKVGKAISFLKSRQESGVVVTLITMDPEVVGYEDTIELKLLIDDIKRAGIVVRTTNEYSECYAVIAGNSQLLLFFHGKILP